MEKCIFQALWTCVLPVFYPNLYATPWTSWRKKKLFIFREISFLMFLLFCLCKFHSFYEIFNLATWKVTLKIWTFKRRNDATISLKIAAKSFTCACTLHLWHSFNWQIYWRQKSRKWKIEIRGLGSWIKTEDSLRWQNMPLLEIVSWISGEVGRGGDD